MVLICNLIEREKTATTKYKAKEIEEKETKALHLCTSKDSFATMVKIYGIPQLFEWTMNSSPFFMAQWFFHSPVCSLITYNSLGLNWLKIANTHKNESFHYCEYLGGCVFSLPHKIVWDYIMQDGKWKIFLQRKWAKRKGFKSFPMYLKFNRTFLCTEYFANTIFIFLFFRFLSTEIKMEYA